METLFSGKSTLILDKKLEDLQSLRSILGILGFGDVQVASSVNMALSMLRERPVDVSFLSYELGRGEKNGLQLLLELQEEEQRRYSACHVLVIEPEKSELLLGSPENAPDIYVSKPYDRARLSQQLEKLMRLKQSVKPVEQLLDQSEWQEALEQCDRQEQLYPGLRVYLQRLKAITHLHLDQPEEAYRIFGNLLEGRDQPWIRIGLAIAACRSGVFASAREQLDHVISQQQICVEAFVWRARLHRLAGELADAQGLLRRAVVLQPTVALLQGDLANLSAMNGDAALAVDSFRSAIRFSRYSAFQHPDYYFGLVRMLLQRINGTGDDAARAAEEEAIRTLEQSQRDFLDQPVIHFRSKLIANEVYRRAGDRVRGDQMASEALELFQSLSLDEQAMWLDQLIEGLEGTPVAKQAQEGRQELTRQSARLLWGRDNLKGMMHYRKGELDEAYQAFASAYRQQPGNPSIGLNLVQAGLEQLRRSDKPSRRILADCDRCLYSIQYAALTPKQQQRYLGLSQRLTDFVGAF
ncbi:MAG: hypothetical protein CMI01_16970 [Oceanospirillaceae bacterium]|jgi:tetratricopeptide (TPR) repeat protein|nr:hypothetical protein [Oceanospirillaceae bacterium]